MLRWRFTATDQAGNNSRLPIAAQSRSAEYLGTVFQPDDFSTNSVPVLHFFVEDPAKADSDSGTTCSLYYNGQFRDRTQVRMRGGSARYWPRKSYKFDLNPGEKIVIRPGTLKVGEFNLNSPYTDKSYVRSVLASEFLLAAGIPAPEEFHLRVLRNASFHSLGIYVEQMDDTFLERHALDPNGSYYKAQGDPLGTYEKKSRPSEGEADLQDFLAGLDNSGPNLEGFLFDQVNLPNVVNYMATVAILQNIDASDKNHYLHRDTLDTREWRILPWDLDLTFGPDYLNTDTMVYSLCDVAGVHCPSHPFIGARPYLLHPGKHHPLLEAVVGNTRAREMLLRRIRTLRDDFLVTGFFENRIEALFTKLAPDVLFDRQTWKANSHFPGKSYTFRQALDRLKTEYLVPRTAFLARTNIVGIGPAMPSSQDAEVSLGFGRIESGVHLHNLEQQFVELVNSNPTAVDISGWQLRGVISFSFPPGTVVPSGGSLFAVHNTAAFRSRAVEPRGGMGLFVQGDYAGSLGAMGGPISLRDSSGRLVSEILFPPVQPSILSLNFDSGSVRLRARGQPAVSYVIERKASLLEQAWTAVGSKSADSTGAIEFTDGIETKDAAFYRLRVQ
jgi:hypothetical protein